MWDMDIIMTDFNFEDEGQGQIYSVNTILSTARNCEKTVIRLGKGIFNEKVHSQFKNLQIIGAGTEKTIITNADGAYHNYCTGEKIGTFRSYTVCFQGDKLYAEGFTIKNTCGDGRVAGQGIALYLDCRFAYLKDIRIMGHQDTLFLAPLPEHPRIPASFKGPGFRKKRMTSVTYLENCYIEGDVDFIFGGGEAIFDNCTIHSLNRNDKINGYVTAPSTCASKNGFTFYRCQLTGDASEESVYLGRPWRPYGNAVFLDCQIGKHITREGWTVWNYNKGEEHSARFGTYPVMSENEVDWVINITEESMLEYEKYIRKTKESLLTLF